MYQPAGIKYNNVDIMEVKILIITR